jgi:hypothetical protein
MICGVVRRSEAFITSKGETRSGLTFNITTPEHLILNHLIQNTHCHSLMLAPAPLERLVPGSDGLSSLCPWLLLPC